MKTNEERKRRNPPGGCRRFVLSATASSAVTRSPVARSTCSAYLWSPSANATGSRARVAGQLAWVPEMPVCRKADEAVSADAVRPAPVLDHPVHDCVYLALSRRIGAVLVMADRLFVTALAPTGHGKAVVKLADYAGMR